MTKRPAPEDTDWPQILALYDLLKRMSDNPMVILNHAIAAAMVHGPRGGARTCWMRWTPMDGWPAIIASTRFAPISWKWPETFRPPWHATGSLPAGRRACRNETTS